MKIPPKIKSQGIWWKIRYSNDIDNLGETDHDKQEIIIRKTLPQELREQTFFHEIGHTLNTTIDHTLLDSFTTQYFQVLKDNKLI